MLKLTHFLLAGAFTAVVASYALLHPASDRLHLGAKKFYSFIPPEPPDSLMQGDHYEYNLLSIDSNGHQALLSFTAQAPIHPGSYLRLYTNQHNEVTDWDEIRSEALPAAIRPKI